MANLLKDNLEWLKSKFVRDDDISSHYYFKKGGEVKSKNVIVNKIGYADEAADYLIEQSPKFAVWLADSILKNEIKASGKSKEEYIQAEDNILKRAIYLRLNYGSGIRTILDWLQHPATPSQNLRELTYEEAFQKANDWHDELEALGGEIDYVEPEENLILTIYAKNAQGVEYYWVLIPSSYCDVESKRMGHCGRTKSGNVLISLRSNSPYGQGHYINDSHITVAYDVGEGLITQAKGKKNQKPAEKYHPYLFDLVEILLRTEQESEYLNGFNGFGSEYDSSEDYGFDDMSKGQIEMLYEIKPTIFDNFLGKLILYDNKIIDAPPNTTIDMVFDADDISRMVNISRDIRDDFVEWVLGENMEYDYSNSWDYLYKNAEDYVDKLNDKNLDDVINRIVELTNLDKKTVVENGASYYLSGEDEEFDEDVFDDIRRSIASAYSNAEESAYYKYYKDQIEGALGELGYVESLNYKGAKMSIDLMDNLSYKQIHQYINEVGDDLKGVFQEALYNGDIEKPDLYVDDRYVPYISDVVFNQNFDIDYYAKGGKTQTKKRNIILLKDFDILRSEIWGYDKIKKEDLRFDEMSEPVNLGDYKTKSGEVLPLVARMINLSYQGGEPYVIKITAITPNANIVLSFENLKKKKQIIIWHIENTYSPHIKKIDKEKKITNHFIKTGYATELILQLIKEAKTLGYNEIIAQDVMSFKSKKYWDKLGFVMVDDSYSNMVYKLNAQYADGGEVDYSNDITVVAALKKYNGDVLILQRGSTANWMPNAWSLVGGMVDEGENYEEAVKREIKEEINVDIRNVNYEYAISTKDAGKIVYFTSNLPIGAQIKLDWENQAYDYVNFANIENYDFVPYVKDFISTLLNIPYQNELLKKLENYIEQVPFIDDEPLRHWHNYQVGDKIIVDKAYDLPESQAEPNAGVYELKVIPIGKTDHYITGVAHNRDYFKEDDYDGFQTELLDRIKNNFDTTLREPIIAIQGKDGLFTIIDGHHRITVANELGRKSILAFVTKNEESAWLDTLRFIVHRMTNYTGMRNWSSNRKWFENLINEQENNTDSINAKYNKGGGIDNRTIYHFTESIDSLRSILYDNAIKSGSIINSYGKGYENISFTWNPNLWDIEYVGDEDYRYKVRIALDYDKLKEKWDFELFDYGIPEEEEEIVKEQKMSDIIPYIKEILVSDKESFMEFNYLKKHYPNLNIKRVKLKKIYSKGGKINKNLIKAEVGNKLYHTSNPMFRNIISEQGLQPQGKSEAWLSDTKIEGKVIFAVNSNHIEDYFNSGYDDDIYEIDTTLLKNRWYYDPNFDIPSEQVVTFDSIPKTAIRLIYRGSGLSEDDYEYWKSVEYKKLFNKNTNTHFKLGGKTSNTKSKIEKEKWSAFDRLAKKVAANYEGKKVKKPYQKKYGKTYDAKEALQVGYAVATKVMGRPKKMALGGEIKIYDKEPNTFTGSFKFVNAYSTDELQDALNYIRNNGNNSDKYYIVKFTMSNGQFLYRVRENILL